MRPRATIGVECVSVPSCAVHFMFLPVWGSKEPGRPVSSDTMLRDQACPHCGWSAADARKFPAPTTRLQPSHQLQIPNCPRRGRSEPNHKTENPLPFIGGKPTKKLKPRASTRKLLSRGGA